MKQKFMKFAQVILLLFVLTGCQYTIGRYETPPSSSEPSATELKILYEDVNNELINALESGQPKTQAEYNALLDTLETTQAKLDEANKALEGQVKSGYNEKLRYAYREMQAVYDQVSQSVYQARLQLDEQETTSYDNSFDHLGESFSKSYKELLDAIEVKE